MFKSNMVSEKLKPTKDRKILFPFKFDGDEELQQNNTVLDIGAYREEFQKFDANEDGLIDIEEFGLFMRALGLIPSDDDVKELFQKMDEDDSGAIEFDEFIHVLDHPMICLTQEEIREDIEGCFKKLVPSSAMSELVISKMSVAQLRKVLTKRGKMKMTDE